MILRAYQDRAIAQLRAAYSAGDRSLVLCAPTGSGKTVVMAAIIAGAIAKGLRVMVVAHTRAIVSQTVKRFREAGLPTGCIMGSDTANETAPVLVASIQTLAARGLVPNVHILIVDEAHMARGASYERLIAQYAQSAMVLGCTATPARLDGKGLGKLGFKRIVEPVGYEELFAEGSLVKPVMYAPPSPSMKNAKRRAGDFVITTEVENAITGNVVEHYQKLAPGSKAIAFCSSVEHAIQIESAFNDAGILAVELDASHSNTERDDALDGLAAGRLQVVTAVGLFGVGWDFPCLETVILARPTMSLTLHRQQCGRVMRPFPGKLRATIIDAAGNLERHGAPWSEMAWSLTDKVKQKTIVKMRRCPSCFMMFEGPLCPCGYVPPVENKREPIAVRNGSLEEWRGLTPEEFYRREVLRASNSLQKLGAAKHRYKDKFGKWPRFPKVDALYICRVRLGDIVHDARTWDRGYSWLCTRCGERGKTSSTVHVGIATPT